MEMMENSLEMLESNLENLANSLAMMANNLVMLVNNLDLKHQYLVTLAYSSVMRVNKMAIIHHLEMVNKGRMVIQENQSFQVTNLESIQAKIQLQMLRMERIRLRLESFPC